MSNTKKLGMLTLALALTLFAAPSASAQCYSGGFSISVGGGYGGGYGGSYYGGYNSYPTYQTYPSYSYGSSYGSYGFMGADYASMTTVDITLNASAISDIIDAGTGYFSIGGTNSNALIFGNGPGIENFLILTTSAVPEPGTLILLGSALAGLGLRRRRRRSA